MKHVKEMNETERAEALAALKREQPLVEPPPADPDAPKQARDMTDQERAEWLREHKRRFFL